MPKRLPEDELDALVVAITANPGLPVRALARQFPDLPRRSLQRRVARLVADGRLHAEGQGAGRRYFPVRWPVTREGGTWGPAALEPWLSMVREESDDHPGVGRESLENYVPLSEPGKALRELMRRPLSQRTPVGYRREFLDGYRPNYDFYLPSDLRRRLHKLGRSSPEAQPAGTYARQIMDRLLVDLSWASSRLEGNTYSRLDTQNLIAFGRYAEGRDSLEAQMILNHKAAIEMLIDQADLIGFDRYTLLNVHALLAENLLADPSLGGRTRRQDVAIAGTVYLPTAVPQLIDDCFEELLAKAGAIEDAFEQAFFVMVQLPYLQPFVDVNKRVSRLAANIPLLKRNLAPLSFVDVPEAAYIDGTMAVYELNRVELLRDVFVWAYERSCQRYTLIKQALPEPDPLRLRYREALTTVVEGVVRDGLDATPASIRSRLDGTTVAPQDLQDFVAMALNELLGLHEGNIARYRLRPAEFNAWKAGRGP